MQSNSERQEIRRSIKEAVATRDAAAVVRHGRELLATSGKPSDTMFCASAFADVADVLIGQEGARKLKTYIVRSVTVEPILPFLSAEAVLAGYVLDVQVGGYGSFVDEMMNPHSSLGMFAPDLVFVLLDLDEIAGRLPELCGDGRGLGVEEELDESLTRMAKMLRSFRASNTARLVVQGCVLPELTSLGDVGDANVQYSLPNAVQQLNERLAALCHTISDCVFFDVDRIAARYGRRNWRDTRLFLASRLPVAANAFSTYSHALVRSFSSMFQAPRKVLCTDLDNTLWGGVLGEEGPNGIATGSAFPGNCYLQYQRYLKQLSSRGILLAIVSKNNLADVEEAFQIRSADLALILDDFVSIKISWGDKVDSLRELARELSLGLDSFVLVDDNPIECEAIRQQLPEVAVVNAPVNEPWKLLELLAEQAFFDATVVTEDDVNRSQEYKAQAKRAVLASTIPNRDEFLGSLGTVCTFLSALEAPLSRSVQLLAKTNQFNLTTRRHSAAYVEEFASRPGSQALAVRVRDCFGDAGVVGLVLAFHKGDFCYIDSLLLSCRMIGRGIETALLAHVAENAAKMGAKWLVGEYVPTRKNALCANFYTDHGFVRDMSLSGPDSESVFYLFNLTAGTLATPAWLTLEGKESNELASADVTS
jgi:FkbH-like protein